MIVGTIVTVLAGFIGYLMGFGEPGVIIGCGGAIITVIGLVLLCCGKLILRIYKLLLVLKIFRL